MVASTNSCTSDSKIRKSRANSLSRKLPVNTIQVLDNNDKSSVFINTPTSMQNMQELDFLVQNIIRQSECFKLDKDGVTLIEPTVSKEDGIIKPVVPATLSAPSFLLELTPLPQSVNAIESSEPFTQALKNIDATERKSPAVELRIDVRKSRSRSNSRSKSPIESFETIRETEVFGNDTLETTSYTRKSKADSHSEKYTLQSMEPKADQFVSTPLRKEDVRIIPSKLQQDGVKCIRVDAVNIPEIASKYNIKDFPSFQFFFDSHPVGELVKETEKLWDVYKQALALNNQFRELLDMYPIPSCPCYMLFQHAKKLDIEIVTFEQLLEKLDVYEKHDIVGLFQHPKKERVASKSRISKENSITEQTLESKPDINVEIQLLKPNSDPVKARKRSTSLPKQQTPLEESQPEDVSIYVRNVLERSESRVEKLKNSSTNNSEKSPRLQKTLISVAKQTPFTENSAPLPSSAHSTLPFTESSAPLPSIDVPIEISVTADSSDVLFLENAAKDHSVNIEQMIFNCQGLKYFADHMVEKKRQPSLTKSTIEKSSISLKENQSNYNLGRSDLKSFSSVSSSLDPTSSSRRQSASKSSASSLEKSNGNLYTFTSERSSSTNLDPNSKSVNALNTSKSNGALSSPKTITKSNIPKEHSRVKSNESVNDLIIKGKAN
ncbi:hypothetical protein HDV04_006256 [Boothiomyces sp. JEL0838]|nr:hypothetical protein HDV04_006256 [Boothiomyces sp. JEL0838]